MKLNPIGEIVRFDLTPDGKGVSVSIEIEDIKTFQALVKAAHKKARKAKP